MYVLGINSYLHDASAALIKDGRVIFATEEERLSRFKKDARFPQLSIRAALNACRHRYRGSRRHRLRLESGWANARPYDQERPHRPAALQQQAHRRRPHDHRSRDVQRQWPPLARAHLRPGRLRKPVVFVDHHESHAWSAYALSGFQESLVLVMDGRGATPGHHAVSRSWRPDDADQGLRIPELARCVLRGVHRSTRLRAWCRRVEGHGSGRLRRADVRPERRAADRPWRVQAEHRAHLRHLVQRPVPHDRQVRSQAEPRGGDHR